MKKRTSIITILLHTLLLLLAYVFQGMIFPYLRSYGYVPLLLPIVSTGVSVYEGRYAGGVTGIFAGILCDVSFNQPAGVFTILLTVAGLLTGALADTVLTRGFATFIVCCAAVLALSAIVQIFPLFVFEFVPIQPLVSAALRQTAYSLLFAVPLWFVVRALGKRAARI